MEQTINDVMALITEKEYYVQVYKEIESLLTDFLPSDGIEPEEAIMVESRRDLVPTNIILDVHTSIQKQIDELEQEIVAMKNLAVTKGKTNGK